jgi:hypothetical protein
MRTPTIRFLSVVSLCLPLLACSSSPLSAPRSDALEEFCSGSAPKAVINGVASKVKVGGSIEMLSCCEGASFAVATSSFDYKIMAGWSVVAGDEAFPASIDLAHPSERWRSWVRQTCSSGEVCYPAPDEYYSGMQGWLEVARAGKGSFGSAFHMSICLRVAETPEDPHPLLHSFELFAPDITASSVR